MAARTSNYEALIGIAAMKKLKQESVVVLRVQCEFWCSAQMWVITNVHVYGSILGTQKIDVVSCPGEVHLRPFWVENDNLALSMDTTMQKLL